MRIILSADGRGNKYSRAKLWGVLEKLVKPGKEDEYATTICCKGQLQGHSPKIGFSNTGFPKLSVGQ